MNNAYRVKVSTGEFILGQRQQGPLELRPENIVNGKLAAPFFEKNVVIHICFHVDTFHCPTQYKDFFSAFPTASF